MIVRIIRGSGISFMRQVSLFVNGKKIGAIKPNESIDIADVMPESEVYAKLDWVKSNCIKIDGIHEEIITIRLEEFKLASSKIHLVILSMGFIASIMLSFFDSIQLFYFVIGVSIYLTYFFTRYALSMLSTGKNRFLSLEMI
ncbi:hypothetical protein [Lewinella sp. 4G2]|uniref:hypothetical protein n=1 Tax=Lewinella sp. 4G2 TaxID=1803372 RepID=UPI0007B4E812|nr:hypothetical protein [Lewinella sp. 4G2]OAV45062.1 hypothetical protein A3850_011440 [Lewinella sp. 4G2]